MTPLHYAADSEHLDVVAFLLASGSEVDARQDSSSGDTLLSIGNTPLAHVG